MLSLSFSHSRSSLCITPKSPMPKMVFYIFASIKMIEMPFLVPLSAIRFFYTEEIMADTKNDSDNQILIDLVKNYIIF